MVRDFSEVPRDAERVIFFPPAPAAEPGDLIVLALARRRPRADGPRRRRPRRALPGPSAARALRASAPGEEAYAMYCELGFLAVDGRSDDGYGYLIYPHRPIVAYDTATGELLSEYCVALSATAPSPTPASGCPTPTTCSPSGWRCAATSDELIGDGEHAPARPPARPRRWSRRDLDARAAARVAPARAGGAQTA